MISAIYTSPLPEVLSVVSLLLPYDIFCFQPEELFDDFDEKPLGTASLAQVHRARLKETGEEVAVKVQHRYVKNHSFVDIYTMEFLVHTVKYFFPQFEFMWMAEVSKPNAQIWSSRPRGRT